MSYNIDIDIDIEDGECDCKERVVSYNIHNNQPIPHLRTVRATNTHK